MPTEMLQMAIPLIEIPVIAMLPEKLIKKKRTIYKEKKDRELKSYLTEGKRKAVQTGSLIAFTIAGLMQAYLAASIWMVIAYAVMYACCAAIMQIDADIRIIPNELLLIMMIDASAVKISQTIHAEDLWILLGAVIAMVIVFEALDKGVNTISRLFGAQAIGMGDIKLMSLLTFFYWGNTDQVIGWLTGFCIAVFGVLIPMLAAKKISRFSFFAFGPYIVAGVAGETVFAFIKNFV